MVHSVGSIGVHVQPDTTDFNENLKNSLRGIENKNHLNIPLDPRMAPGQGDPGFVEKLRKSISDVQRSIDHGAAVIRVPIVADTTGLIDKLKITIDRLNATNKGKGPNLKVGIDLDDKALATQAKAEAAKVKDVSIKADLDVNRDAILREFAKLNNSADAVLHPDLQLDRGQLTRLRAELDNEVRQYKERIAQTREELARLRPDILSIDPKVNTEKARLEWKRLKDSLSGDTVDLKADLDRQGIVKAQLALLTRNRVIDLTVRISTRSMATAKASLASLTGVNLLSKAALGLEGLFTNLDTLAFSTAKVGTSLATIGSSALSATSSILGLVGGIGALGGYVLAAPAGIVSLAAAFVVGKMAFAGFGAAIKGTKGAMDKLPPQAQAAAKALRGVWKEVQTPVQEAFWSKMSGAFEGFVKNVIPELKAGLITVGTAAGNLGSQLLQAFSSLGGKGIYSGLFSSLAAGMNQAAVGMRPLVEGFFSLATEGAKALPDMGREFRDMAEQFDRWVQRSIDNGKVTKWINDARTAAHDLGQALIAIKGQFTAIWTAAQAGGTGNLTTFADTMKSVRRTMESPIFQNTLTNLFAGAHQAIGSMKDGLKSLGRALYDVAPALKQIMTISGATVGTIFKSLADAIQQPAFKTGLVSFFTGVQAGITDMLKYLPQVADGLGHLFDLLGTVAKNVLPVVGQLFGGVADLVTGLSPALKDLVPILANFASDSLGIFLKMLNLLAVPMRVVLQFFEMLPGGIQTAILALLALMKYTSGSGMFGGFKKTVTDPMVNALRNDIPAAAGTTRNALSRPLGTGFLSASAFTPFMTALRAIPAGANASFSELSRNFNKSMSTFPGVGQQAVTGVARAFGLMPTSMNAAASAARESVRSTFAAMPADVRASFGQVGGVAENTTGRMSRAFSGLASAGKSAMSGLFNFIGGGWGIAFAAGFAALASVQAQSQQIADNNKKITQSYKDIAKAATDAGQQIGGVASQQAALTRLNDLASQKATGTTPIGIGTNSTVGSLLSSTGLSNQDIVNVMTGKGSDSATAFITGMRDKLQSEKDSKSLGLPDWLMSKLPFNGDYTDMQASIDDLNSILDSGKKSKEAFDKAWETNAGRATLIPAVFENLKKVSADGKITLANISGIQTDLYNNKINPADTGRQLASSLAESMGGDMTHQIRDLNLITQAVKDFRAAGSVGDIGQNITTTLTRAGTPVKEIKADLDLLGYSAEEQAHMFKFVWGPALDAAGKPLTVLGEQIPLLREGSKGIAEFSQALGAAANIDPHVLTKIFTADGLDLAKMAQDLPAAGVGLDTIREALKAAGVTGPQLSDDMGLAAAAASKLIAATSTNLTALSDFATGLDTLKNSAGDAATQAGSLFDLLDKLGGSKVLSGGITATLWDSVRTVDDWKTQADTAAAGIADAGKSVTDAQEAAQKNIDQAKKDLQNATTPDAIATANQAIADAVDQGAKSVQTAIDSRDKAIKDAAASPTMLSTVHDMLTTKSGAIDFTVKGASDVIKTIKDLTTNAIAEGIQTYNDAVTAGSSPEQASAISKASLQPIFQDLEKVKDEAGLTDAQWNTLLTTFGLTPDSIAIDVKLMTDGTMGQLAAVAKQLEQAAPGVVIPVTIGENAAEQLKAQGLDVQKVSDGKYQIALSVDPTVAQEQLAAIKTEIETGTPAVIPTGLAIPDAVPAIPPIVVPLIMDIDPSTPGVQVLDDLGKSITLTPGLDLAPSIAGIQALNSLGVQITISGDTQPAMEGVQFVDDQGVTITMGADTDNAMAGIQNLDSQGATITIDASTEAAKAAIDKLNGSQITITANIKANQQMYVLTGHQADGSILNFYGNGGFIPRSKSFASGSENHVAQFAPAGSWRTWAEPETGGEAYIPLAFAKRARSLAILSDVATEFGYQLTQLGRKAIGYADGGGAGMKVSSTSGPSVVVNQYNPVTEKDSVALMRAGQLVAAM